MEGQYRLPHVNLHLLSLDGRMFHPTVRRPLKQGRLPSQWQNKLEHRRPQFRGAPTYTLGLRILRLIEAQCQTQCRLFHQSPVEPQETLPLVHVEQKEEHRPYQDALVLAPAAYVVKVLELDRAHLTDHMYHRRG